MAAVKIKPVQSTEIKDIKIIRLKPFQP